MTRKTETPDIRARVRAALESHRDDITTAGVHEADIDALLDAIIGDNPPVSNDGRDRDVQRWSARAQVVREGTHPSRTAASIERDIARACQASFEEGRALGELAQRECALREHRSLLTGFEQELSRRARDVDRDLASVEAAKRAVGK